MAGDWIKLEHSTSSKPETLRIAELLGIERREAFGLIMEYFVWLDQNLSDICPDFVRHISAKSFDSLFDAQGFAACLASIGWAKFDDRRGILTVVNAARHNGKPAKTRAEDAKRKSAARVQAVLEMSEKNRTSVREIPDQRRIDLIPKGAAPVDKSKPVDKSERSNPGDISPKVKTGKPIAYPGESREAFEARCRAARDAAA